MVDYAQSMLDHDPVLLASAAENDRLETLAFLRTTKAMAGIEDELTVRAVAPKLRGAAAPSPSRN